MLILLIETSTERGVVAYGNSQKILFQKELPIGLNQSSSLLPYLAELFETFGNPPPLDLIGVGIGPGSYTGIRIGVAAAQALAYCLKIPLAGISSLTGFVPSHSNLPFAAVLDARIGGVYYQKGTSAEGRFTHEDPQISTIENAVNPLKDVPFLVTPAAKSLQAKFALSFPDRQWIWEERSPSLLALMQQVENQFAAHHIIFPPSPLNLLYLRETEAEREASVKRKRAS